MTNSEKALDYIHEGYVVGLGTGRASVQFIHALGKAVADGLKIRGVPTSESSGALAEELGIPLATLEEVAATIDVTVDGADEVDPEFNLVKGLGGALVREKIVAASSAKLVILVGPDNLDVKLTDGIGTRGVLPVEVTPFGLPLCVRKLKELGCPPVLRLQSGQDTPFITDNGNYILDCKLARLSDPVGIEQQLNAIPGILGTGLFIGMADVILIQNGDQLEIRER